MNILALHRQQSAVGYYRTWLRARTLRKLGHDVTYTEEMPYFRFLKPEKPNMDAKFWAEAWMREHLNEFDLLICDRAIVQHELQMLSGFKHYSEGCRMMVDFDDDFTNVPVWNHSHPRFQPGQEFFETGVQHLRMAEMTTVSTAHLAENFKDKTHNIRCLPNRIEPSDWNYPVAPDRHADDHIRVLYGGASGHYGDLEEARPGIEGLLRRQPVPWRLICFGSVPAWVYDISTDCPGKVITLPWVPFEAYAQVVAWGGFDIALAPLQDCEFNLAKSNIKWLEAGIQRIPFLCSKVGEYAQIPDGCAIRVENSGAQWAQGLLALLEDETLRDNLRDEAYQAVMDEWTIDKGEEKLQILVEEARSLPRIETLEDTRLPSDD